MRFKLLVLSGVIFAMALAGVRLAAQRDAGPTPTFNKDVAPIIFNNCVTCHRPDQVAPMSLMSYEEVRPWARAIRDKVIKREMPPWFADPRFGEFRNDRRLSAEQIQTIVAWADGGAPRGDTPLTAQLPRDNQGWAHPSGRPPDLVVEMAEAFDVPAQGELPNFNIYQELPSELKKSEERFIEAIQILPGVIPATHHTQFTIRPLPPGTMVGRGEAWPNGPIINGTLLNAKTGKLFAGSSAEADEAAAAAGAPRDPLGEFNYCCYVPGGVFRQYRPGLGQRIPNQGYIVWGLHYTTVGRPIPDRTKVGMWFQRDVTHEIEGNAGQGRNTLILGKEIINDELHPLRSRGGTGGPALPVIPPFAKDWAITAITPYQDDVTLYLVWPHMHTRGKEMTYVLTYPDGREQVLLSVPKYDFNWQIFYELKEPLKIPAGSTIKTVGSYDNSSRNKWAAAPHKEVYWSEQSWDEMYNGFRDYSVDKLDLRLKKTSDKPTTTAGGGQ